MKEVFSSFIKNLTKKGHLEQGVLKKQTIREPLCEET